MFDPGLMIKQGWFHVIQAPPITLKAYIAGACWTKNEMDTFVNGNICTINRILTLTWVYMGNINLIKDFALVFYSIYIFHIDFVSVNILYILHFLDHFVASNRLCPRIIRSDISLVNTAVHVFEYTVQAPHELYSTCLPH